MPPEQLSPPPTPAQKNAIHSPVSLQTIAALGSYGLCKHSNVGFGVVRSLAGGCWGAQVVTFPAEATASAKRAKEEGGTFLENTGSCPRSTLSTA